MLKKLLLSVSLLLVYVIAYPQDLPPKSNTLVTDYTNTLSGDDKQALENKLVAFNDSTSTQIAIVILKSVGEYDINEYGQKLGRAWGIGSKDKNNGILVLVALGDRKLSIQTGYGAEGALPDVITHEIIQNDITPRFKQNDYYGGLNVATDDLMKYMRGEYKSARKPQDQEQSSVGGIIILVVIIVFVLIILFRRRGGGGGGQIYGGRGGASPFWWFLGGAFLGRSSGGWGGFSGGNGGFGGGNDSGGGDFGGFGGGDFGGGGSSGSW